mgnify:CR=1 FL=1
MKRVRLIIAYDGTNYCGWQVQINGITVEEVLNKALKDLLNEEIAVIGASRTDSGVHAMGNVAVWEVVVSFIILVASIIGVGMIGSSIYRMGTLRYGNPIKITTAIKSLRKQKNK